MHWVPRRQIQPDDYNRHLIREYGRCNAWGWMAAASVSGVVSGRDGTDRNGDGRRSCRALSRETRPDLVIAIDALAARNTKRLNRTIQMADTGIQPGSGVGNHSSAICTKRPWGFLVIAIGVPTVVDAATIVNDSMENLIQALETSEALRGVGLVLQGYNATEKYELVKELISPSFEWNVQ